MAIILKDKETSPAIIYDRIFLDDLRIRQAMDTSNSNPSKYKVEVFYRIYAVDAEDIRHFKPGIYNIYLPDYLEKAMQKASRGDMDMLEVMRAIEQALAALIEDQGVHSIEGVA